MSAVVLFCYFNQRYLQKVICLHVENVLFCCHDYVKERTHKDHYNVEMLRGFMPEKMISFSRNVGLYVSSRKFDNWLENVNTIFTSHRWFIFSPRVTMHVTLNKACFSNSSITYNNHFKE